MDFNIEDFTEAHYTECIKKAMENYEFLSYEDFVLRKQGLVWRHDIDMSLHRAIKLAQIEAGLGLKATYFIHMQSEFYSILEKECNEILNQIVELGHDLAIHFDPNFYGNEKIRSSNDLSDYLLFEKGLLKKLTGYEAKVFSFHNPDIGEWLKFTDDTYGGLINTYSTFFKENVAYCSDSNGYWRFKRLYDFLNQGHRRIQVLTHPVWWTPEAMMPRERIVRAINGRAQCRIKSYDDFLESQEGRINAR